MKMSAFSRQMPAVRSEFPSVKGMRSVRLGEYGRLAAGLMQRAVTGGLSVARAALVSGMTMRRERQAAVRISPRIRRGWTRALERMGREEVRYALESSAMTAAIGEDRIRFVDVGLAYGVDRFPTRNFVETWLGDDDDEEAGRWRIRVVVVFGFVAVLAMMLGVAST